MHTYIQSYIRYIHTYTHTYIQIKKKEAFPCIYRSSLFLLHSLKQNLPQPPPPPPSPSLELSSAQLSLNLKKATEAFVPSFFLQLCLANLPNNPKLLNSSLLLRLHHQKDLSFPPLILLLLRLLLLLLLLNPRYSIPPNLLTLPPGRIAMQGNLRKKMEKKEE